MLRMFETNEVRSVKELDGLWDFVCVNEAGEEEKQNYKIPVPGCWEQNPSLSSYRGKGVYRKTIHLREETTLRFVFKGISHTAHVYFDDQYIAYHYNAYTAFDAIVRGASPGKHELRIVVDNGFHEQSSLHMHNDYYTYGGLIRPVAYEKLKGAFIERIAFLPTYENGLWSAQVKVTVKSVQDSDQHLKMQGKLGEQYLDFQEFKLTANGTHVIEKLFTFPDARSWDHDHPHLYHLTCELVDPNRGIIVDDLTERVGFRTVLTQGEKIHVNGKPICLKGFNRHEDHAITGASFPLELMVQDLELMVDLGCNSVRTSHYPNDERFLDLCDEYGFYVWEENHARGLTIEQMRNPHFIEQCAVVNQEMVEQHYNHPSIIIWAILNECASYCEEGKVHYARQLTQIRQLDHSRPLSFASHHREREICFDLADIVSFNLYPGWYGSENPAELADEARGWANAAGGAGKPMIMSEFGADGYYGYRSPKRVKGTEERQADIIADNLAAFLGKDYISGMFIWQFADCRVTEEKEGPLWRPQTLNNKGVLDAYRRPKLAYDVVKAYFTPNI